MPSSSMVFARSTKFLSIRWVMSGLLFDVGRWCARPCDGQLTPAKRSVGLLKCDACRRHTSCLFPTPGLRHVPLQRQWLRYSPFRGREEYGSASQLGQERRIGGPPIYVVSITLLPGEFLVTTAKGLLQQNLPLAVESSSYGGKIITGQFWTFATVSARSGGS